MPSFDVVSEVDQHELQNAIDQANREISNRFDFKGSNASFELEKNEITVKAPSKFQVEQMCEVLKNKLVKRSLDVRALKYADIEESLSEARMPITVQTGIDKDAAKKIQKQIKDSKIKVQSSIQGEQIRVTGKKRDDLQQIMAMLKESELQIALQFTNFRD